MNSLSSTINGFGFNLYNACALAAPERVENLFVSPLSIAAALSMLHFAAVGETAREMNAALNVTDAASCASRWEALMQKLVLPDELTAAEKRGDSVPGAPRLRLANGVWAQGALSPDFIASIERTMRGAIQAADFSSRSELVRREINAWVEARTNKRITDLLPGGSVDASTTAVLVNALHLEAKWQHKFKSSATRANVPFHIGTTRTVPCSMMLQTATFNLTDTPTAQYVLLPYVGGKFAMELLVPKQIDGLRAIEEGITPATFAELRAQAGPTTVELHLPKFTATWGRSIRGELRAAGLSRTFSPAAEFPKMFAGDGGSGVFPSDCFHKTFIRVDEDGTEAAAATAVMMLRCAAVAARKQPVVVRVDRPTLVALTSLEDGSHLFIGRLADPSKAP